MSRTFYRIQIIIIITLLFNSEVISQYNSYLSFQPGDNGIGLRFDVSDFYISASRGEYRFKPDYYIKDHIRMSVGHRQIVCKDTLSGVASHVILGLAYHQYGENNLDASLINQEAFKSISIEIGASVTCRRLVFGIRYDILKREGIFDFGFRIK